MTKRENSIARDVDLALGSLRDLLWFKNPVGEAVYFDAKGRRYTVPYGLGVGSPDRVGILAPSGRMFAIELKTDRNSLASGESRDANQRRVHDVWRAYGAFVATVHNADEARAAIERARRGESK